MKTMLKFALAGVVSLGLGACGGSDATSDADLTPGTPTIPAVDAAVDMRPAVDLAAAPVLYSYLVVQDTEADACTTNGPGADIDAVEMLDATGTVIGVGLKGSAQFFPRDAANGGPSCADAKCPKGKCSHAAPTATADLVEGVQDAKLYAGSTPDEGYISLNGGSVRLQIGDATGGNVARALKTGDVIRVWEVDHNYITGDNACVCKPETFQVLAQAVDGTSVRLVPTTLSTANTSGTDACPALSTLEGSGCGTTVFVIP